MKRFSLFVAMLLVACTQPSYPGIDRPSGGGNTAEDQSIIDYIDQRLENEYYWLDEVGEKVNTFNRNVAWENYLSQTLSRLESNTDDGYINSKGQRVFYSYISEYQSSTRASVSGFGIELHYTIVVIDNELKHYGFLVESVYPDSPAAEAGIKRGDIITMIGGSYITSDNYVTRFNSIQSNAASSLKLKLRRQTGDKESFDVELAKGAYAQTPVIYNDIIELEGYHTKIGYLVYTGFESEYDDELLSVLGEFAAEGVGEVILDLRCNGGGSVASAVKLCSALVPAAYEEGLLCQITRNPKNTTKNSTTQQFKLENTTAHLKSLTRLTVICSDYSASASELVIMGLRGLDFPVTLVGSTTEGKNCGMDVTRTKINDVSLEYAPITFMCFDAKGFGGWGDGITPDVDLTIENELGVSDKNYPLPRADWGDQTHDIGLVAALAKVTERNVSTPATRSAVGFEELDIERISRPVVGVRNYVE